jgi:hypothetical protein
MHSTGQETAATPRRQTQERAKHAARWALAYADAKPSVRLVGRMFNVSPPTVLKAITQLQNGNGNHALTIDNVVRWWAAASDADRAAFVRTVGVGSAWRAIESNLG